MAKLSFLYLLAQHGAPTPFCYVDLPAANSLRQPHPEWCYCNIRKNIEKQKNDLLGRFGMLVDLPVGGRGFSPRPPTGFVPHGLLAGCPVARRTGGG